MSHLSLEEAEKAERLNKVEKKYQEKNEVSI